MERHLISVVWTLMEYTPSSYPVLEIHRLGTPWTLLHSCVFYFLGVFYISYLTLRHLERTFK